MNDLEISKALALAIGWKKDDFSADSNAELSVDIGDDQRGFPTWKTFDYRDWAVISPIAERYDCFPRKDGGWYVWGLKLYDTPQKAIAMAVIEGAKK